MPSLELPVEEVWSGGELRTSLARAWQGLCLGPSGLVRKEDTGWQELSL